VQHSIWMHLIVQRYGNFIYGKSVSSIASLILSWVVLQFSEDRDRVERGIRELAYLINNKTFLLTFIRTLEQQQKFTVWDRVELGSLISVALQPNMEYHTE